MPFTKKPIIVSLSGGKDSTAMLHRLLEKKATIVGVLHFDGGWEHEEIGPHLRQIVRKTGLTITTVRPLLDFTTCFADIQVTANQDHPAENIKKGQPRHRGYGWPSKSRRWCTDIKTRALKQAAKRIHPDAIHAIGYTIDEHVRAINPDQVQLRREGRTIYPLIDDAFTQADSLSYCRELGYHWHGLYNHFSRVSCWCCPLRSLRDWRETKKHRPYTWVNLLELARRCPNHHQEFNHGLTVEQLAHRLENETNGATTTPIPV